MQFSSNLRRLLLIRSKKCAGMVAFIGENSRRSFCVPKRSDGAFIPGGLFHSCENTFFHIIDFSLNIINFVCYVSSLSKQQSNQPDCPSGNFCPLFWCHSSFGTDFAAMFSRICRCFIFIAGRCFFGFFICCDSRNHV